MYAWNELHAQVLGKVGKINSDTKSFACFPWQILNYRTAPTHNKQRFTT